MCIRDSVRLEMCTSDGSAVFVTHANNGDGRARGVPPWEPEDAQSLLMLQPQPGGEPACGAGALWGSSARWTMRVDGSSHLLRDSADCVGVGTASCCDAAARGAGGGVVGVGDAACAAAYQLEVVPDGVQVRDVRTCRLWRMRDDGALLTDGLDARGGSEPESVFGFAPFACPADALSLIHI